MFTNVFGLCWFPVDRQCGRCLQLVLVKQIASELRHLLWFQIRETRSLPGLCCASWWSALVPLAVTSLVQCPRHPILASGEWSSLCTVAIVLCQFLLDSWRLLWLSCNCLVTRWVLHYVKVELLGRDHRLHVQYLGQLGCRVACFCFWSSSTMWFNSGMLLLGFGCGSLWTLRPLHDGCGCLCPKFD